MDLRCVSAAPPLCREIGRASALTLSPDYRQRHSDLIRLQAAGCWRARVHGLGPPADNGALQLPAPFLVSIISRRRASCITPERRRINMKVLMVLTSHDQLGNTGRKTGFWLEEFAAPYFVFRDAGVELTLASPKGGLPPIDPKSDLPEEQTPAMTRFKHDAEAQKQLSQTVKLSDMKSKDFDSIFYVGGHGPMWDIVDNPDAIALIESFYNAGKPVAAVCHSSAVLHRVMYQGEL